VTPFGKWLAELGLGRYDGAFAPNEIDFDVIRSLTDADLRELGLALGDRKRLLQAVARLDAQPAADTLTPPTPLPEAAAPQGARAFMQYQRDMSLRGWNRPEIPAYTSCLCRRIAPSSP
jgi:hypothetical protein